MYKIEFTEEALNDLVELQDTHQDDASEVFRVFQNASKSENINNTLLTMGKYAGYQVKIVQHQVYKGRHIFILKAFREGDIPVSVRALYAFCHTAKILYVFGIFIRNNESYTDDNEQIQRAEELFDKYCSYWSE